MTAPTTPTGHAAYLDHRCKTCETAQHAPVSTQCDGCRAGTVNGKRRVMRRGPAIFGVELAGKSKAPATAPTAPGSGRTFSERHDR